MNVARSPIEVCISDVCALTACNKLKLNSSKTELVVLNARHRPEPPLERLLVCGDNISSISKTRNTGVTIFKPKIKRYKLNERDRCARKKTLRSSKV